MPKVITLMLIITTLLVSCSKPIDLTPFLVTNAETSRWYSKTELEKGTIIYNKYCSSCHLPKGEGSFVIDGTQLPMPPLDGKGHVWRYSVTKYMQIVSRGRGRMPAFRKLSEAELSLVLASIQSHWDDKKYKLWQKIQQGNNK